MQATETLDSVTFRFRVSHHRSLRGLLRVLLVAAASLAVSVSVTAADVFYISGGVPWLAVILCTALAFLVSPYLSESCEARFTATHLHILDRGRRRSFPLAAIAEPVHRRKALQLQIGGQRRLLFKDLSKADAAELVLFIEAQLAAWRQRMQAAGHDLSTPAAPPPELVALTKHS